MPYPGAFADVFVVCAFVSILEAAPTAHVVNENGREVRFAAFDVLNKLLECDAAIETQPAPTLIT